MKILTIFVRYGTVAYPQAERELDEFYRALPGVERRTVVLDNAMASTPTPEWRNGTAILAGDNAAWEFSAWDKGIQWIGKEIWSYDLVHLVTSAFGALYTAYIPRFTTAILTWASSRPVFLGHIDCFNDPVEILSFRSQYWMRSCFLFLRPSDLRALGSLVTVNRSSGFFSGDPAAPFAKSARLSRNYRENITGWLTGRDIGQGVTWHSAFEMNQERLGYFEEKTMTILNEHLLSIRLRALGCFPIDVTWLSGVFAERREAPSSHVGWREQLRKRPVDALVTFAT